MNNKYQEQLEQKQERNQKEQVREHKKANRKNELSTVAPAAIHSNDSEQFLLQTWNWPGTSKVQDGPLLAIHGVLRCCNPYNGVRTLLLTGRGL